MPFSYIDNTDLVEHLKKGNEGAYTYLTNSNYRLLFNYALSLTNDTAMAQDIVQEVFLYVWKNRRSEHL
jgi:RNA polymerase sigma-70 factor (ECF subfamily)